MPCSSAWAPSTKYPDWSLPVTVKDMTALRDLLTAPTRCAYPDSEEHVRLLHDQTATRQGILDGLTWLKTCAEQDPDATIVVYYSGHGWVDEATGRYYLIPHDVEPFDLQGSALAADEFNDALRAIPAKRLLVFIDSCHAEGMATAKEIAPVKLPPRLCQERAACRRVGSLAGGRRACRLHLIAR